MKNDFQRKDLERLYIKAKAKIIIKDAKKRNETVSEVSAFCIANAHWQELQLIFSK